MEEKDIKAATLNYLLDIKKISRSCIVANEYALAKSSARADIAILSNKFIGVEIKSHNDSLKRLLQQISAYRKYFDTTILIIASRHVKKISIADYTDIEIIELDVTGNFHQLNSARAENKTDENNLVDLLTQVERRRFYEAAKRVTHAQKCKKLQTNSIVRDAFEAAFANRYIETSELFWRQVRSRKVKANDMETLSRYREQRQTAAAMQERKKVSWANWISEMNRLSARINETA